MSLYAWAVLRSSSVTADASGDDRSALDNLAGALFCSLSRMDPHPDSISPEHLCQLFQAHQVSLLTFVCAYMCVPVFDHVRS